MSRTDAHTPLRVRLHRRDLAAHPDHAPGHTCGCDLPSVPPAVPGRERCRWTFDYTGTRVCCCPLCHPSAENRRQNRVARHRQRRALHDATRAFNSADPSDDRRPLRSV